MHITKTSEKIIIWMTRNNITGQEISKEIGITRQAWSNKLKDNIFAVKDLLTIRRMGFDD
jgi:predicted transcriptional regulator